jgi:hypothetical protein
MKLSNNIHSNLGLSYQTVLNNQSYTIHSGITRPCQFSLGNIRTMSGITDSIGEGWDDRKITKKINERNNIVNGQEEVPMTRSKHFEHAYIVGTLKDGYVRKVPLPRAPRGQHANHVTTKLHDICCLPQVPRIPTWSDLTRSLADLGRKALLPFSLALM